MKLSDRSKLQHISSPFIFMYLKLLSGEEHGLCFPVCWIQTLSPLGPRSSTSDKVISSLPFLNKHWEFVWKSRRKEKDCEKICTSVVTFIRMIQCPIKCGRLVRCDNCGEVMRLLQSTGYLSRPHKYKYTSTDTDTDTETDLHTSTDKFFNVEHYLHTIFIICTAEKVFMNSNKVLKIS